MFYKTFLELSRTGRAVFCKLQEAELFIILRLLEYDIRQSTYLKLIIPAYLISTYALLKNEFR